MSQGQAALDFLMTYGWAILVILMAFGALAYLGVFNPDRFIPDRCDCSYTNHSYFYGDANIDNMSFYDCYSLEPYIDYEIERIVFIENHSLYSCVNKTMEMIT